MVAAPPQGEGKIIRTARLAVPRLLAVACGAALLGACASSVPVTAPSQKAAPASASTAPGGCLGREREYTLEFRGFSAQEIAKIENYLVIFRCYGEYRPIELSPARVRYSYYSRIAPAKLATNLNRMLGELEEAGGFASTLSMDGSTFAAAKIRSRR